MTVVSLDMAYRGSGKLITRLDTPPLSNRRHPDSPIALRVLTLAAALLIATPAVAANPGYCALWSREFIRIEMDHIDSAGLTRDRLRQALELDTERK